MSDQLILTAEGRSDVGKGAGRRLRRLSERVPGIVYGGGNAAIPVTLSANELAKAMQNESFYSQILNIKIDGGDQQAVVRDIQRHPANERVQHIDFLRIRADRVFQVSIPIHFLNEDTCVGVKTNGGNLVQSINELEVSCLPADLPEFVELDVAALDIGDILHISDIALPEGVSSVALALGEDYDSAVVSVAAPRAEVVEEPSETDEEGSDDAAPDEAAGDEPPAED